MEQYLKPVDWDWTQGNYGFLVIFTLTDKQFGSGVDVENYDFFVNVQRGENPLNVYTVPCETVDMVNKKIEYLVRDGDLSIGDEYYYIEVQGIHKDQNITDDINENRKITSQDLLRVFVRSAKEIL